MGGADKEIIYGDLHFLQNNIGGGKEHTGCCFTATTIILHPSIIPPPSFIPSSVPGDDKDVVVFS